MTLLTLFSPARRLLLLAALLVVAAPPLLQANPPQESPPPAREPVESEAGEPVETATPTSDAAASESPSPGWQDSGGTTSDQRPADSSPRRKKPATPRGDALVLFNTDGVLGEGEVTEAVVTINGSSTVLGRVNSAVVALSGDTRVEGAVGQAVVTVFGNSYINTEVREVVAVFGGIELGPHAVVHGPAVAFGGSVVRHPGAQVLGQANSVRFLPATPDFHGFRFWLSEGLFKGRPLVPSDDASWAWAIAFAFFLTYVLVGALLPRPIAFTAELLETRPALVILAALLATILTPVLAILLIVTALGPFALLLLVFLAAWFGKAALLAWIGWRFMPRQRSSTSSTLLALLLGGAITAAVYCVPVAGVIFWCVTTFLALGLSSLAVITAMRSQSTPPQAPAHPNPSTMPPVPTPPSPPSAPVAAPAEPAGSTGLADASAAGEARRAIDPTPMQAPPPPLPRPTVPRGPRINATLPRAGFWIRMCALMIDLILVSVVFGVLGIGAGLLPLLAIYGALMWKFKNTTIGGVVCRIAVVRADDRPVDWSTSIVRALGCFLSLIVAGLGFIWIAFDPDNQAWHDRIAGTVVVRVPAGISLV